MLQRALLALIRLYQLALSPLLPQHCRYYPSCSEYTREAVARHGAGKGFALGVRRVCRCHPWHSGGYDPVPAPQQNPDMEANRQ